MTHEPRFCLSRFFRGTAKSAEERSDNKKIPMVRSVSENHTSTQCVSAANRHKSLTQRAVS